MRLTVSTGTAKPIPAKAPARADNLRIHTDQSTGTVEQRPTGISRIDGRIGLNNPFNRPIRERLDRPPQGAHHAGRQRMIEAEGIPDRQDFLPDTQVVRRPDGERRERVFRRTNLQHGHIVIGVGADERGLMLRSIGQRDSDRVCPVDDMKIRDDVPLLVPDEPCPGALRGLEEIEGPGVSLNRRIRNEDHRFRRPFEHSHCGPLI